MGGGSIEGQEPATELLQVHARRRAAIIAGHKNDGATATELVDDPSPDVRCAALGALERSGLFDLGTLVSAMEDAEPSVRSRAIEIAGHRCATGAMTAVDGAGAAGAAGGAGATIAAGAGPQGWEEALVAALDDPTDDVCEMAAWALGEIGGTCGPGAIEALKAVASQHTDPLCREAAIAALGATGDPEGLGAVLQALTDLPAIRRRAAVALAGFDDPRVADAWRTCLADKDRQVRYIAEDLLAEIPQADAL